MYIIKIIFYLIFFGNEIFHNWEAKGLMHNYGFQVCNLSNTQKLLERISLSRRTVIKKNIIMLRLEVFVYNKF